MEFENQPARTEYYERVNLQFLLLLWAHLPIALLTAYLARNSYGLAVGLSLVILSAPTLLVLKSRDSLEASIANAVGLVSFSALLIHLSGGMTELHFHIFASFGLMIILAQPVAIISALLFVVVHHVGFFFLLPKSLISYDAGFGILVIHALFALGIGVPAIFISRKFKLYIVGVNGLVGEIRSIAGTLLGTTQLMTSTSSTISSSTNRESAAMRSTKASLDQLTSMIGKNSAGAANVARLAEDSKGKSARGLEVMENVIVALRDIQSNSNEIVIEVTRSNQSMNQIIELIEAIGEKTKVINDIVFQTKLLSFNASVEAARAGEHGKGFAVVAEEVGNLAQMSGNSAKEISALLQTSTQSVQKIIEESKEKIGGIVSDGQGRVERGLSVAENCKRILAEIDVNLNRVSADAQGISEASHEQASGVEEINKAMTEVEEASRQNTQAAAQASDIAQTLNEGTYNLNHSIQAIQVLVRESEDERATAPAA